MHSLGWRKGWGERVNHSEKKALNHIARVRTRVKFMPTKIYRQKCVYFYAVRHNRAHSIDWVMQSQCICTVNWRLMDF